MIKNKLDKLAEEMIDEVKDLKNLTKENLPEVAKEYIKYNLIKSGISFFIFGLIFILGLIGTIQGILNDKFLDKNIGSIEVFSLLFVIIGGVISITEIITFLQFYLQPKSKAIEGVIKLFSSK